MKLDLLSVISMLAVEAINTTSGSESDKITPLGVV